MKQKSLIVIVAILAVFLLSGCVKIYQEVTFLADDKWQAQSNVTFLADVVAQLGDEFISSSEEDFQQQIDEAKSRGITAKMEMVKEKNGDVVFKMSMEGQGLALLNEAMFENAATITSGSDGRITFRYDASEMTEFAEMGGTYTFVLKAGKVHSHNATKAEGNTLTWENPTKPIEAQFNVATAGGGGSAGLIIVLVIIGVLVLLGLAVAFLYMRGKRTQSAPPSAPPSMPA